MTDLSFRVLGDHADAPETTITLTAFAAVVAGYTGRDRHAVQEHIDELAAIGVAPPIEVPMFYAMDERSVTSAAVVTAAGDETSGEVEPLYVRCAGRYYLGVASDHTDRRLETVDVAESKRACPKPVAGKLIAVDHIDRLDLDTATARSWVDGEQYQEGQLSRLLPPREVVERFIERRAPGDGDFVLLGGTLPLIGGAFRYGREWRIRLDLPDGRVLEHAYRVDRPENREDHR